MRRIRISAGLPAILVTAAIFAAEPVVGLAVITIIQFPEDGKIRDVDIAAVAVKHDATAGRGKFSRVRSGRPDVSGWISG